VKVILVEYDFDDGITQAEVFKSKESLTKWYKDIVEDGYDDSKELIEEFKERISIEYGSFNIKGYHYFTIYYNYEVV